MLVPTTTPKKKKLLLPMGNDFHTLLPYSSHLDTNQTPRYDEKNRHLLGSTLAKVFMPRIPSLFSPATYLLIVS